MSEACLLEARDVSRSFGQVVAAQDINITIRNGELIGIIGTNGAGKTTFLNMVTGYIRPSKGDIVFKGHSIVGLAPRDITRRGISRSFQVAQVFTSMSVLDNLLAAVSIANAPENGLLRLFSHASAVKQASALLERFGLAPHRHAPAVALPQGARKLLDIAMAIAGRPDLLLLDEPTSGVSTQEKLELSDIIMAVVRERNITSLIIEHDMDVVSRCAERVIAFHQGRVLADGPTGRVLADPRVSEHIIGG
jgi:branched-chain amino acid transport system ATP-binding protein